MGSGSGLACDLTLNSSLPAELRPMYQNQDVIRRILGEAKTVAIVGLSPDRQRASHFVATYLGYMGYQIIPVNPRYDEIMGRPSYPSLRDVPETVDLVDVFRRPSECLPIVEDAIAIGARALWLQLRVINLEAAALAQQAGLSVVVDRCVKMEHGRYNGSMHWVGMNTGIISAKRDRRWF